MRDDTVGLFWNDTPPPKILKEKIKRTPPAPTWLADDYLPNYEEALSFPSTTFTDAELIAEVAAQNRFIFDVECFANYFLVCFMSVVTGKRIAFEYDDDFDLDRSKLTWLLTNAPIIGFNSNDYDIPIIACALAGSTPDELHETTRAIIVFQERSYEILKRNNIKPPKCNHIDLIEVAPLQASLKIYGGRLHAPRMQNLPFAPERELNDKQKIIVRWYCVQDLINTAFLYMANIEQIKLREALSVTYGIDLRSKSDAQVAEAVIAGQVRRITGQKIQRPEVDMGAVYKYDAPKFLKFQTPLMNDVMNRIANADFTVIGNGTIDMPSEIAKMRIQIGHSVYRMGVGGLHSSEQRQVIRSSHYLKIKDIDVVSYYPRIILNTGLYPPQMGQAFLEVYRTIVKSRLEAKARGDKSMAESLKITINGTFGKLGSPWSTLYAPDLLIQVTITGQLSLLMLIEMLELANISVASANTDGIVIVYGVHQTETLKQIIKQWETETAFETEETEYSAVYSRDVNNYIAVKPDGKTKTKGAFSNPWSKPDDGRERIMRMHKNPQNQICVEALEAFLIYSTPIRNTIEECCDIRKFVSVRTVKGGGVTEAGEYLGKAIRWYYAKDIEGYIVYALTGNHVPRSKGAKPAMLLPETFPEDIDYEWYIRECYSMLVDLGVMEESHVDETTQSKEST